MNIKPASNPVPLLPKSGSPFNNATPPNLAKMSSVLKDNFSTLRKLPQIQLTSTSQSLTFSLRQLLLNNHSINATMTLRKIGTFSALSKRHKSLMKTGKASSLSSANPGYPFQLTHFSQKHEPITIHIFNLIQQ
jgi:hypothetical protein